MAELSINQVIANLNAEVRGIKNRTKRGLNMAGNMVKQLAQLRVPVEYGELRDSAFVNDSGDALEVQVGFSAPYAVYVHENLEQRLKGQRRPSGIGVYWGPHGRPKFLESAYIDLHDPILQAIANHARVPR